MPDAPMDRTHVDGVRAVVAVVGVCVGVSGLDHGFFEALQGDAPTPGFFVQAIGPAQRMWVYGTEDAFTLVPNFLATGFLAVAVGVLVIIWSLAFLDRPGGSRVLLGLGSLLFLVGGGVAMLVLLTIGWAMARRIGRPIDGTRPARSRLVRRLTRAWPAMVAVGAVLYALALEIAIAGFVPGVSDPDHVRAICWVALAAMLLAFLGAFVGASHQATDSTSAQTAKGAPRLQAG